ncbi:MAG: FAD-binding oxidoreductase [Caulobacterales bacterium]|nr:FAD-binding oxidoreductase [Caulobacterales bacterium]
MLGGCATVAGVPAASAAPPSWRTPPPLAPIRAEVDRIMNITVCLRPFRAAGPRLDAETVGDKLVVHNYGHGGSGWSLSWGSGLIAVKTALAGGAKDIAVIGCGALGLTAATLAQRAGARVTIYAKERMPEVRSARATGLWTPDSRIGLESKVGPGFAALWEEMARNSFRVHQRYLGLADAPVEWTERYNLFDTPPESGPDALGFVRYGERIRDLTPHSVELPAGATPFPVAHVRRASLPMFNITEYGHVLMTDFLIGGGRIETMEFHTPAELAALPQKVVINCTGYGARALWKDESIVPVRGQLTWLIPQPEVSYGLYYRGVGTVARRDGMIVQKTGADDSFGLNDDNEAPDRAEAEESVKVVAGLFARRGA